MPFFLAEKAFREIVLHQRFGQNSGYFDKVFPGNAVLSPGLNAEMENVEERVPNCISGRVAG